ncbi:MAG: aminoacetone oxidase family FAD-binding enzyme [Phycisphaera sp.]|nr:aminoacetone oxidase family FAD-binding enzyme [Phycisphaera sp.]
MNHSAGEHGDADRCDIAIVGAGAAGLMAGVHAARALPGGGRVVGLDGARRIGAKILVAGGGRCNVTHHEVRPEDYAGSSRPAIRKVLGRFSVPRTIEFFSELGVELKRESTGKLFPVTNKAATVLTSLLDAWRDAEAELRFPRRVASIEPLSPGFRIRGEDIDLFADRVILATGGRALPKSGSDGAGYAIARKLGHTITDAVHPALVPLLLEDRSRLRALSGISAEATMEVRDGRGRGIATYRAPLLCTHFGISGPVVLDASRHLLSARSAGDTDAFVVVDFLPDHDRDSFEAEILGAKGSQTIGGMLRGLLSERLVLTLAAIAGLEVSDRVRSLSREARVRLLDAIFEQRLEVVGDRGYTFAEATAGGVPLSEIRLDTMESRVTPGLHLIGEILDVDGRVGGFNFQWAWASGHVAGLAAAKAVAAAASGT